MEKERIIFWLPTYPEIMESFIFALSEQYNITIICMKKLLEERTEIYRSKLNLVCDIKYMDISNEHEKVIGILEESKEAVQIFGGFLGKVGEVLKTYNSLGLKKAIVLTEKPSFVPCKYFNRLVRILKKIRTKRRYSSAYKSVEQSVAGVLVTGLAGVAALKSYGIPAEKLFNFMYTHIDDEEPCGQVAESTESNCIKFLYVGRFEYLNRGMDNLIYAFNGRTSRNWSLDLVGGYGNDADEIIQWAETTDQVRYIGSWKSNEVIKNMREYDVCISPTRLDGWRIQINQAIIAGIATVTTNEAVSDELIKISQSGMVVDAFNNHELRRAVTQIIDSPQRVTEWKRNATTFSEFIQNKTVADYFVEVVCYCTSHKGERPKCPWIVTRP